MGALGKAPLSKVDTSLGSGAASMAAAAVAAAAATSPAAAGTGLWVMSVTYLGWPIHLLASVLCFVCSELLVRLTHATRCLGKELVGRDPGSSPGNKTVRGSARNFVVRLKNLPQVRGVGGWVR